jgi:glucose/arabinose dehydrogenase
MLRIDVDGAQPYAMPADNPFAGGDVGAPEVWAFGLRNPWRWSFDGDRLFIGDVGQNRWEEVSVTMVGDAGLNYGWPIIEGTHCFERADCDPAGFVLPVIEYGHDAGCSVTGGYVYRGSEIPELVGHYFYGDYCGGWVNGALIDDAGALIEEREWAGRGALPTLTSFGLDGAGELYATTADGRIWRLQRS